MNLDSKWEMVLTGRERRAFSVIDQQTSLLIANVHGDNYADALDNAKMIQMLPRILEFLTLLSNYKETGPENRFDENKARKALQGFVKIGDEILSDRAIPGNIIKTT